MENYVAVLSIEAKTMIDMIRHDILPAVSKYAADLCGRADSKKNHGLPCGYETSTAKDVAGLTDRLLDACAALVKVLEALPANPEDAMRYCHDTLIPSMAEARAIVDGLETITAAGYWPMPVYSELLFSV